MFNATLNTVTLELELSPRTGFLIKADTKGGNLLHPERPDLMALRGRAPDHLGGQESVFIPGSSLKGVVRSAAERVLRSLNPGDAASMACDPMDHKNDCHAKASRLGDDIARGKVKREQYPMAPVYRMLCGACRSFGSQALAGRIRFADAYPADEKALRTANKTETRAGVSIDRRSGGPARGKLYESEVVVAGSFAVRIHMENVQLWQVALIGVVLEDLREGIVRVGSGKTRGLGMMDVTPRALRYRQLGAPGVPAGVGALAPALAQPYGLIDGDTLREVPAAWAADDPVFRVWEATGTDVWDFFRRCQTQGPWQALVAAGSGR